MPADLQARIDDELRELTALLASIDEEGKAVVQAAEEESAKTLDRARADAARAIASAQLEAPEVRAAGAAARIKDRQAAMESVLSVAAQEAVELRDRARTRMDEAVNSVLANTFAGLTNEERHVRVLGGG